MKPVACQASKDRGFRVYDKGINFHNKPLEAWAIASMLLPRSEKNCRLREHEYLPCKDRLHDVSNHILFILTKFEVKFHFFTSFDGFQVY